ncbi:class I adenylate-forming enzyme family protein [Streptomyces sp. NPDC096311]|uniref:class I adenylate-forming enzyme family protein n=1 Tax=Streptomyces sp. NPDC096311 TaxID=3366083 RepID=UPI003815E533
MGLETLLDVTAGVAPDRIALGTREDGMSFAGLAARARGGATLIRATGARHVVHLGVNGPAFACAVFAAALSGVPITPLNYRLPDDQLLELLAELQEPMVLADPDMVDRVRSSGAEVIAADEWLSRAAATPAAEPAEVTDDSVAVVLFTSGTTSRPKRVLLRHRNLLAYVLQTVDLLGAGEDECTLASVPPYHVAGVASVLSNVYAGRRVVHLPSFAPERWLDLVKAEGVTSAMLVPTMLTRIVDHLGDAAVDVPTLATIAYGGARVSPTALERALRLFPGTGFVNAYGLTETSSTIALLGPEDHRAAGTSDDPAVRARLGSAGRAVPGVEFRIRDEEGQPLGPGVLGELWVRGPQISGEYAGIGSLLDADGWFPTRDRAMLDGEGYLFIEGRSDDTIIRGGENVAPAEVEDVLSRHPAVGDVGVVGVPDEEWGERIAAAVVLHPGAVVTAEELRAFAKGYLRSSRTPDEIVVWTELPYTETGKLLRRRIAARLAGEGGIGAAGPGPASANVQGR